MADILKLSPIIARWEGGFVNDPLDRGGATNMGVTLSTWKQVGYDKDGDGDIDAVDIKLLTPADFARVLKLYWDRWRADEIKDQQVANILVDWVWGSGKWGIVIPQRLLGVTADGVVGPLTIKTVNARPPFIVHGIIFNERRKFLNNIVLKDPKQGRFLKGWLNRLQDFRWKGGS